ncbi:MAG: SDR family oxidoreductase [Halioglobus sp.]
MLEGKVYIVTGGSRGFGLAMAKNLVEAGAKVGITGRDGDSLQAAVSELGAEVAIGVVADVASRAAVSAAFSQIVEHFGRLDGLVNNAGLAKPNKVENLAEDEVLLQVNTNFVGTVNCCQVAIALLRGGENPRIINISSASAWHYDEMSHLSIYASTKAAVERFTRDLYLELQHDHIGVTCIRPGGAGTGFADTWEVEPATQALTAWLDSGTYMSVGMDTTHVANAVRYALEQPPGVAVDLLEVRPNNLSPKQAY